VAIVTGAGRGIGRAIALELAARGAAVGVVARSLNEIEDTAAAIEATGGKSIAVRANITNQDDVDAMAQVVRAAFGDADLLVNNAASVGPIGPVWESDPDEWWQCVEVSVRGSFLCARAVLPGMFANRRGRIINIVSGYGLKPTPYFSAYAAAKAAEVRLMDTIAAETAAHGISAFAILPGTVRTAMTEFMLESPAMQKYVPEYRTGAPTRFRPPEDTARLVAYLASGAADALSGRVFDVGRDDPVDMVARAEAIARDDTYAMRLAK
jgi:NAD(P)-dependent dehydrogenase (short-subunit alcohol dehydrogenase family)